MVTLAQRPHLVGSYRSRVEILGVFGAGKTTLAERLADSSKVVIAEEHERISLWGDDIGTRSLGYLAYDLSFLLQHAHLVATLNSRAAEIIGICDWSFVSDRLWASMRLGNDFSIYDSVYKAMLDRVGPPVGYIYLRQPVDVILSRLHKRGRIPEAQLPEHVAAAERHLDDLVNSLPVHSVMRVEDGSTPKHFETWLQRCKGESVHV